MPGTVRGVGPDDRRRSPAFTHRLEGWFGRLKPRGRLARGLKAEADIRHFVGLMARGRA